MDFFENLKYENLDSGRKIFYYAYMNNIYNDDLSKLILDFNEKKYIKLYITHSKNIDKTKFIGYILKSDDSSFIYNTWFDNDEYLDYADVFLKRLLELKDERRAGLLLYYYHVVLKLWSNSLLQIEEKLFKTNDKEKILAMITTGFEKFRENFKINTDGFSPKCYKGHNDEIPCLIVCHISNMYEKILYNFYDDTSDVSSHFVIGRKGEIKEVVSLDDSAWCNGTSLNTESDVYYLLSTSDIVKNKKMNANYFSFSIEHESFDGSLTEEQYQSSLSVMKKIIDYLYQKYNYKFIIDREHIIGHKEVNPIVRTKCPGKEFPFDRLINDLNAYYNK